MQQRRMKLAIGRKGKAFSTVTASGIAPSEDSMSQAQQASPDIYSPKNTNPSGIQAKIDQKDLAIVQQQRFRNALIPFNMRP
ncbi:MAG: hypothetical protein ACI8RA_002938 [Chlamydiales bacterium]|jgi:hypothetical protein